MKSIRGLLCVFLFLCFLPHSITGQIENIKSKGTLPNTIFIADDFGAKGNAVYKKNGNPFLLESGIDNAKFFDSFISTNQPDFNVRSGSIRYITAGIYKTTGSIKIHSHNLFLQGAERSLSIVHPVFDLSNRDLPAIVFGDGKKRYHGGGISNMSIQSEPFDYVRNNGIFLDYMEYMSFVNVSIEGFNKCAVRGSIQESYFDNVRIFGCGGGLRGIKGIPEGGVIDYNSTIYLPGDASNNTLFSKLTFSSCYGTHVNLVAPSNTTENIHFNGFYDETDPFNDAGVADDLPIIYMKGAANIAFSNGFITVNSTRKVHQGTIIRIDDDSRNGKLTFTNFHFNMNPTGGYQVRLPLRLRSVMQINGENSRVMLSNVTISDAADMIGFNLSRHPPLFEGNGRLYFDRLEINVRSKMIGGSRSIDNVFDPSLGATGWIDWRPYDQNGPKPNEFVSYYFENGKILKSIKAGE